MPLPKHTWLPAGLRVEVSKEALDGCFELGEVILDGGGEDGVGGIEMAVSKPVAHA